MNLHLKLIQVSVIIPASPHFPQTYSIFMPSAFTYDWIKTKMKQTRDAIKKREREEEEEERVGGKKKHGIKNKISFCFL